MSMSEESVRVRIEHLVQISASPSRKLSAFFEALDHDGWAIEMARTYLGIHLGAAIDHEAFAKYLALRTAREYRTIASIATELRGALVNAALKAFDFTGAESVSKWLASIEINRWHHAWVDELDQRIHRRGRPLETLYSGGAEATTMEAQRLAAHLSVKRWCAKLGTSENTYRARVCENTIPVGWFERSAKITPRLPDAPPPVTRSLRDATRLDALRAQLWTAYVSHAAIAPVAAAHDEIKEELEIDLSYTPDAEEPLSE